MSDETTFCPDCAGERGGFSSGTEKCSRHKADDVISTLTARLATSLRACEDSGLAYEVLVEEVSKLRAALAAVKTQNETLRLLVTKTQHDREVHWRTVESLRERLDRMERGAALKEIEEWDSSSEPLSHAAAPLDSCPSCIARRYFARREEKEGTR